MKYLTRDCGPATGSPRRAFQRRREKGAVAIMFGLSIFALFGFMALVVDLGRTYVVRTELQNAADAAALAGAMELNQRAAGVTQAMTVAKNIGLQNRTRFSFTGATGITITDDMLAVGTCPDESCMVPAATVTTDAQASGRTFLRVNIPSGSLATFFARVPTTAGGTGTLATTTFGRAVAGHFVTGIMPMGVCAIDPLTQGGRRAVGGGLPDELTEFGFRRGVSYNIPELNPIGGSAGVPLWINPLDAPPGACDPANSSTNIMKPFVCTGTSSVITSLPGQVYVNTGGSYGPMEKALNSRMDDFIGGNACDPGSAPPDINIEDYGITLPPGPQPMQRWSHPRIWMQPDADTLPERQSIETNPDTGKPVDPVAINQYGALWAYSRAAQAAGAAPNATAGTAYDLGDWENLYGTGLLADTTYPAAAAIPPAPAGTLASPYNTAAPSSYFTAPNAARPGRRNRRVLNIAILDCSAMVAGPGLACAAVPVVGVGKFFMQKRAALVGMPHSINTEFAGLINPFPTPEVRLYR